MEVMCLLILMVGVSVQTKSPHPHLVFILADDLGWGDVSLHGSTQIPTPNIDALAGDGILLNNYYVMHVCTPSRGALMTGKYPIHLGLQHLVIAPAEPFGLGLKETTMPQYLQCLGYTSHLIGKWHLGMFAEEYTPLHRGFDSRYGINDGKGSYLDHTCEAVVGISEVGLDFWRNDKVDLTAFGQYSTEIFTTEAERIIAKHDPEKPLFLYMPHQAVHEGNKDYPDRLYAPWKYMKKFEFIKDINRRKLAGMISALDDSVGNVTKALYVKGMLNNTIIVFSTDNGGPASPTGYDYTAASNYPLRGSKNTLWEGGVRGTGFVWSPLLKKSSYFYDQMFHISDWLPTLLEAAGYNMSELPKDLDGYSQWQALSENKEGPRQEILLNIDPIYPEMALRVRNWKIIKSKGPTDRDKDWYKPKQSLLYSNYKEKGRRHHNNELKHILRDVGGHENGSHLPFIVQCVGHDKNVSDDCQPSKAPCLYNLSTDPCEMHNLADKEPEKLNMLLKRLEQYETTMVKPRNKPVDPAGYPSKHGGVWRPWVKLDKREVNEH